MAAGTEAVGGRLLPRVNWGPVVAGVFLAIAADIVLGLVGGALGFAAAPTGSTGLSAGAAIWGMLTPFVATLLGAWLAIRMAGVAADRPGSMLHGIMVWAIGLLAGAVLLTGTVASLATAAGNLGSAQRVFRGEFARPAMAAGAVSAALGGAALASIAGLLGAVVGVGIARGRRTGFGWRLAIQRREGHRERPEPRRAEQEYGAPYGEARPTAPAEPRRDVGAPPPTSDPYHH